MLPRSARLPVDPYCAPRIRRRWGSRSERSSRNGESTGMDLSIVFSEGLTHGEETVTVWRPQAPLENVTRYGPQWSGNSALLNNPRVSSSIVMPNYHNAGALETSVS